MVADILTILDAMAKERAEKDGSTYEQAYDAVLREHPDLYRQYEDEARAEQVAAEKEDRRGIRRRGPRVGNRWDVPAWTDPQVYFLQSVFQVVPEVESQLRDMINLDEAARTKALNKWSRHWHLNTEWCRRKGYVLVTDPTSLWPPLLHFTVVPLEAMNKRADARKLFEDALTRALRETEDHAKQQGWVAPGKMPNLAYFSWAARYQVKGESARTISKSGWGFRYELTETRFATDSWAALMGDEAAANRVKNPQNYAPAEIIPEAVEVPLPDGPPTRQAVEYGYRSVLKLIELSPRPDIK